jgi:carnitine-CoA ligase
LDDLLTEIVHKERICPRILERHATERGNKTLLKYQEKSWTYQEVDILANRIGNKFSEWTIEKGNHVLIMMPNVPEFIFTWLGLTKIGAVEVPVNTAYKGNLLKHIINDSRARTMVIHEEYLVNLAQVSNEIEILEFLIVFGTNDLESVKDRFPQFIIHSYQDLYTGEPARPEVEVNGTDPMAIMYTSGTTGNSKGVIVTYFHAYSYTGPDFKEWFTEDDCYYLMLPLFHVGGQWAGFYLSMCKGAQVALFPKFTASKFWDYAREYGCTITLLLGAMANFLVKQPERPDDHENPIRRVNIIPLIKELESFSNRFKVEISTGYGSTEASSPISADTGFWKQITETNYCGQVRQDFEVQVVDENDVPLPPGKVGELCVRSKLPWSIMTGYYNLPEKTLESWKNLWFHTGDAMYYDESGNYFFVDRINDSIRRRGENISSTEVEGEVLSHPSVMEVAAVAVESEYSEDEIKIVVVLQPNQTIEPEELIKYLESRMPYFMVPRYIQYKDSLPKTPTNKIKKVDLRKEGITSDTWDREVSYRLKTRK